MIVAPTVTPLGDDEYRLTWTGTASVTVRVFVNGLPAFGPEIIATAAKEVEVSIPSPGTFEVHETADAQETVVTAGIPLERRPLAWWLPSAGADHYEVYLGSLVGSEPHETFREHYEHRTEVDVRQDGGSWTTLRVEAISPAGASTTATAKPVYAPGVIAEPTALAVTGGAGLFDIALTVP